MNKDFQLLLDKLEVPFFLHNCLHLLDLPGCAHAMVHAWSHKTTCGNLSQGCEEALVPGLDGKSPYWASHGMES